MIDKPFIWTHPAIIGKHVISMTREYPEGSAISVATCRCGWVGRRPIGQHAAQDRAIKAHWQSIIDAEANAA